jgi:hypothetical protein
VGSSNEAIIQAIDITDLSGCSGRYDGNPIVASEIWDSIRMISMIRRTMDQEAFLEGSSPLFFTASPFLLIILVTEHRLE